MCCCCMRSAHESPGFWVVTTALPCWRGSFLSCATGARGCSQSSRKMEAKLLVPCEFRRLEIN